MGRRILRPPPVAPRPFPGAHAKISQSVNRCVEDSAQSARRRMAVAPAGPGGDRRARRSCPPGRPRPPVRPAARGRRACRTAARRTARATQGRPAPRPPRAPELGVGTPAEGVTGDRPRLAAAAPVRCHNGRVRPTDDTRERTLRRGYASGSLHTGHVRRPHRPGAARPQRARAARAHGRRPGRVEAPARARARQSRAGTGADRAAERRQPRPHHARALLLVPARLRRRHGLPAPRRARPARRRWHVVDLGSSNGTYVNGRRVNDAEVRPGDELVLGGARLVL
jgi:hypothetical protein